MQISSGQVPDVVIRERSESMAILELRPRFELRDITGPEGERFIHVGFLNGILSESVAGSPMIPFRAVTLDLQGENWQAAILDAQFKEEPGIRIAPHPLYVEDAPGLGRTPVFSARRQTESGFHPKDIAVVERVAGPHGRTEALVKLFPVQYDEATHTLRTYDVLVVKIWATADSPPGSTANATTRKSSPMLQGDWYKMDIQAEGIYKLDLSFFTNAGISPADLANIHAIRIYGNGGRMLPEDLAAQRPAGLQEIARLVVDKDQDGMFDAEDYLLFYGASPRGWRYNPSTRTFHHFLNYYTEINHYFFTVGDVEGKAMDSLASGSLPAFAPADFQEAIVVEEERNILIPSGRQWFGQRFDPDNRTVVYTTSLPGHVPTRPTTYRFVFLARSPVSESFVIEENGGSVPTQLGNPVTTLPVDMKRIDNAVAYQTPVVSVSRLLTLAPGNRSVLRFSFSANSSESSGWLDWFEILYRRTFEAVGDVLLFTSPDTTAMIEYRLSGFSGPDISVFDISTHDSVLHITNLEPDPVVGSFRFRLQQTSGGVRRFLAVGPGSFLRPSNARRIPATNLRGFSAGAEVVIVSPRAFRSEADRLKAHREQRDSLSVMVVDIDDIQNEYSGGLRDPMAVRDFLRDALVRWTVRPRYVLLFGDGHYDYRQIRVAAPNWIPPYETMESVHQILSYASDDHLVMLTPGNQRTTLAVGRIPVNSVEEARIFVDKIIAYESATPFTPWRNRVTYVADDGLTSTGNDGSIHTSQAEALAQTYTPAIVEKKKIYIVEYPTFNSASGRRKPTANTAIIDAINRGTLILNYTGHGNPQLWAHEAIFTREGSLPLLKNRDMQFLLVAATCDFARYDNPAEESTGELILRMAEGGAIAVVTASRAVYSFQNSQFNNTLYSRVFQREADGRSPRLGDVMLSTKQVHSDINDRKYHLFGDPTMRLNLPPPGAVVDSVNGAAVTAIVRLHALSRVQADGSIRRPDGSAWTDFNGRALLEMFDSKRRVYVPEWSNYSFEVTGSLLYRGEISISGGSFSAVIPVPKDVSYDNNRSRMSVYAWSPATDAVGFTENIVITGTDSLAAPDSTGPRVEVFLQDESFRSGDLVPPNATLLVKLFDENGVNTSTASVGHRMEAVVSALPQPIDLTAFYRSDLDTYQSGEARYELAGLPEGRHSVRVKAWDTYNNSSQEELYFEVRAESNLGIYQVFNFPNPLSRSTVFTFQRNSSEPVDIELKIFTLAGRVVKVLKSVSVVDRFVRIPWDGRDQNGDPLANGVYFYKVITRLPGRGDSQEAVGKLSILR